MILTKLSSLTRLGLFALLLIGLNSEVFAQKKKKYDFQDPKIEVTAWGAANFSSVGKIDNLLDKDDRTLGWATGLDIWFNASRLGIGLNTGYVAVDDDKVGDIRDLQAYIPVMLGLRFNINRGLYISGNAGAVFDASHKYNTELDSEDRENMAEREDANFAYGGSLGYNFNVKKCLGFGVFVKGTVFDTEQTIFNFQPGASLSLRF